MDAGHESEHGHGVGDEDAAGDGAEQAFEALRAEVAALRRGMELVFRQVQQGAGQQVAPAVAALDYSPTLGAIARELKAVEARLGAIEGAPALASTPVEQADGLRRVLRQVEEDARRGLAHSQGQLDGTVAELRGMVRGALERQEQKRWLWTVGVAGVLGGVALLIVAMGVLPWGLGARLAALPFGGRWDAGQAFMEAANPEAWERIVRVSRACPKDSTTDLCEAVLAVRTIAPDASAPPTPPAQPVPDGAARGPAFGTVPGPARSRAGR